MLARTKTIAAPFRVLMMILVLSAMGTRFCLSAGTLPANVYVLEPQKGQVSQYQVGAKGSLKPLTPAFVSVNKFPICLAAVPKHHCVYIGGLTSFGTLTGSLSRYTQGAKGELMAGGHPLAVPLPISLAATPDEQYLYMACRGKNRGEILQYEIGQNGTLTPLSPASVPLADDPWTLTVSPDGQHLYAVADRGIFQFRVGQHGALTPLAPALAKTDPYASAVFVSPNGQNAYVVCHDFIGPAPRGVSSAQILAAYRRTKARTNISLYHIGLQGGLVAVKTRMVVLPGAIYGLSLSPDGRTAYVPGPESNSLRQYPIDAGGAFHTGSAVRVSVPGSPQALAQNVTQPLLYVSSQKGGSIWAYTIRKGGRLSPPTRAASLSKESTQMIFVGG